jgi:hypothetical protein
MIRHIFAVALLAIAPTVAVAQNPVKETRLVVFNAAGPNFADFGKQPGAREKAEAHRKLYLDLAVEGLIVVGGNLRGDTPLGVSVFAPGVTREQVAARLEADVLVREGVVKLDYRTWEIQMGALTPTEKQ